ncbi:MAG: hypothetical protein KY452_03355 [Actinobacteria bacterium]|nr:hypothetical protein [Actinomycetota bacterium]
MRPFLRLAPLAIASVLLVAAGCGSNDPAPPTSPAGDATGEGEVATTPDGSAAATPEDRLAAAPAATIAAGSARTTFVATVVDMGGPGSGAVTFGGEGEIDFENQQASSRSDLSNLLRHGGVDDVDGEMESVVDGAVSYVRSPFFATMVGAPTPWVRIDPAALESVTGMDMTRLSGLTSNDPKAQLAFLAGVVEGSVEEVGAGEVRGTPTTRLRARVDLRKAVEDTGAMTDRRAFEQFVASLGGGELAVEVDLDDDDRVRQLAYEHRLPGGGGGHQRIQLEYFDFGADVAISIPPDDQVTDLADLLGAGG